MGKQEIRQRARQQALGAATRQRQARIGRERRVQDLAVQVLTAMGERDTVVTDTERRPGVALAQLTRVEGLTLGQALAWCADQLSMKEAIRLRQLATETATDTATQAAIEAASEGNDDCHGDAVSRERAHSAGLKSTTQTSSSITPRTNRALPGSRAK